MTVVKIVVILSIYGAHLLDQLHSNPDVTLANDFTISHDDYAISHYLSLVQKLMSRKFHLLKK